MFKRSLEHKYIILLLIQFQWCYKFITTNDFHYRLKPTSANLHRIVCANIGTL